MIYILLGDNALFIMYDVIMTSHAKKIIHSLSDAAAPPTL